MKAGAYFINTSPGEIVDEPALLAAVREKGIVARAWWMPRAPPLYSSAPADRAILQSPGLPATRIVLVRPVCGSRSRSS